MTRTTLLAGCLLAALAASPLPAQTALDHLAAGNIPAARAALAAQVAGRPDAALHAAFLEGLILLRQGRRDQAAAVFRKILSAEPRFEPARRELTALLVASGQIEGAIYHAERLLATTQDDRLKAGLSTFIAGASLGKPRGVALRFALLPSENANGGTDAGTIVIGGLPFTPDPASRAQRAIGATFGATAWNRWSLSDRASLTAAASLDVKEYDNAYVADEATLALRLDMGLTGPKGRLSFGPRAEVTWKDHDPYRRRIGFGVSGQAMLRPGLFLSGGLSVYRQRHDALTYQDGSFVSGSLGLTWIAAPDLTLSLGLPFAVETTRRPHLDHRDIGLSVGVEKSWPNGLVTGLSVGQSLNRYDGDYPAFGVPRKDRITTAVIALRHRDLRLGAFVPELSLTATDAASNIPLHDYRKLDVGLNFTQRF